MKVPHVTKQLEKLAAIGRRGAWIALVGAIMAGLSACDGKDEPKTPSEETEEEHSYLTMIVHTSPVNSRAEEGPTWGDYYNAENGNSFENHINPQRIHVVIYRQDGTFITDLYSGRNDKKVMIQTINEQQGLHYIYFDIAGLGLVKGQEYMASVTANYEGLPTGALINDGMFNLSTLIGTTTPVPGENYYQGAIPMFGFLRWTSGNFSMDADNPGFPTIGSVSMLRSVCKIEVRLADIAEYPRTEFLSFSVEKKPRLAYVKDRHINVRGHLTPRKSNWAATGKKDTRDLTFDESFYEMTNERWTSATSDHLYFQATADGGRCYYIYLPEASGASMAPNLDALRLNVTLNYNPPSGKSQTVTGTLFPSIPYDEENQRYPAGTNFNNWKLVRNHIYRFTITDFTSETELKYRVSTTQSQTIEVPDFD